MTITASAIVSRVRTQLIDPDGVRWTDVELLRWLTDACRTIVSIDAGASSTTAVSPLVSGTKQTIPADGHMLLTIVRNITADTVSPGRAVRIVSREILDATDPDWHTSTPSLSVQNYIYDPQEPRKFYIYPPSSGGTYVEMVYSVYPPDLTELASQLVVQDIYFAPLVDYVMYRAYQKDSDYSPGLGLASSYMQSFMSAMGQTTQSQLEANPNLQLTAANPAAKGAAKL